MRWNQHTNFRRLREIKKKVSVEVLALFLMLSFGLTFMLLLAPLNTPDEGNHFLRAYQISDGGFVGSPQPSDWCVSEYGDIYYSQDQTEHAFSVPRSVSEFTLLDRNSYDVSEQFKIRLDESDRTVVCARQTTANSPVGYLPQALTIFIFSNFGVSPIFLDYAARLAVLFTWSLILFWSIKIAPARKWAIIAVALLPMSIQQSISIGTDVLAFAPAALLMAVVMRSYYEERAAFINKDLLIIFVAVVVATLSKPVMIFLLILVLLYRADSKRWAFYGANRVNISWLNIQKIILGLTVVTIFIGWSAVASSNNVSATDIFVLAEEKSEIIDNDLMGIVPLFVKQSIEYISSGLSLGQFGSFGWFSKSIPELFKYFGVSYLAVIMITGYEKMKWAKTGLTSRCLLLYNLALLLSATLIVLANIATLFIIWTPIDAAAVEGVQFRYFIPALFVASGTLGLGILRAKESVYSKIVLVGSTLLFIVSVLTLLG